MVDTFTQTNSTNSHRVLNKRLSRIILYGSEKNDSTDRCSVLRGCIDEISRLRKKMNIVNVPKIVLLYGGEVEQIKSIHRFIDDELDQKKFGLVVIRVRSFRKNKLMKFD